MKTPQLRSWWLCNNRMKIYADCRDDMIYACSDFVSQFKNKHIKELADFMRKEGGFTFEEIPDPQ